MKNVILTGATGMIGKIILLNCLQHPGVNQVTSIVRKPTGIAHGKLTEIIHGDFLNYDAIAQHLKNQDVCFYCIGVYTGAVSRDEFRTITFDYTKAFAEELRKNNDSTVFCFLSGAGADQTEKSRLMFAKDKGAAENYLVSLNFSKLHIFRPAYIYPVTRRKEPNLMYRLVRIFYKPIVSKIYPNAGITSVELANVMTTIGLNGGDRVIYENRDIRREVRS